MYKADLVLDISDESANKGMHVKFDFKFIQFHNLTNTKGRLILLLDCEQCNYLSTPLGRKTTKYKKII